MHAHHLLLLEKLGLVGSYSTHGWLHNTTGHGLTLRLLLHVATVTVAALSAVVAVSTTVVLELVETTLGSSIRALVPVLTLVVVLTVLAVATAVHVVLAVALHSVAVLLAASVVLVKILHEVLLDFVEAALLALLMELLCWHPELNG